ncbi:MAG TPA: BON domain-containing protein [Clostridia bacterium]|nr:BON domain-containing protein [Clostridia bacterium]
MAYPTGYYGGPGPYGYGYGGYPYAPSGPTGAYGPYGYPYGFVDYTDFYDYNSDLVLEDNEIQDLVSDTIAADPYIPQSDVNAINVEVKNGVVRLSGTVSSRRSKPLAYADAFWARGVVDVESNLVVKERGRAREGGG